jgi:hypothetical protein
MGGGAILHASMVRQPASPTLPPRAAAPARGDRSRSAAPFHTFVLGSDSDDLLSRRPTGLVQRERLPGPSADSGAQAGESARTPRTVSRPARVGSPPSARFGGAGACLTTSGAATRTGPAERQELTPTVSLARGCLACLDTTSSWPPLTWNCLAADQRAVTHEVLDELAAGKTLDHLRAVLVAGGMLPDRDERLVTLERWTFRTVTSRGDHEKRAMLHRYAVWHHLRRLRARVGTDRDTHVQVANVRSHITAAVNFLDWPSGTGLTLSLHGDRTRQPDGVAVSGAAPGRDPGPHARHPHPSRRPMAEGIRRRLGRLRRRRQPPDTVMAAAIVCK